MEAFINSVSLGDTEDLGVFRLSLADSGLSTIQSITIEDDNVISGGRGAASGFDLDAIKISSTLVSDPADVAALPGLDVFLFNSSSVFFRPGFFQAYRVGDPASWNQNRLFGTAGTEVNFALATFGLLDGVNNADFGGLSIGEGGRITFNLTSPISTSGLYLYVSDIGGGNDAFRTRVSTELSTGIQTGVTLIGTAEDDVIDLSQGINASVGEGNDDISGGAGNDVISAGAGNDLLKGDEDNDILNGGRGNDTCQGFDGDDLLNGGIGKDRLTGGLGADQFVFDMGVRFNPRQMGRDVITDFRRGSDRIVLDRTTFKRFRSTLLQQADFEVVENLRQAKQSEALITYIPKSGALFYNENRDQTGFGQGGQFTDLTNGLNLSLRNFTIGV